VVVVFGVGIHLLVRGVPELEIACSPRRVGVEEVGLVAAYKPVHLLTLIDVAVPYSVLSDSSDSAFCFASHSCLNLTCRLVSYARRYSTSSNSFENPVTC